MVPVGAPRLPSEAEWESAAAARADFSWGDVWECDCHAVSRLFPALWHTRTAIIRAMVRHPAGIARRLCGHRSAYGEPEIPQFLYAGAQRCLRRFPQLRPNGLSAPSISIYKLYIRRGSQGILPLRAAPVLDIRYDLEAVADGLLCIGAIGVI